MLKRMRYYAPLIISVLCMVIAVCYSARYSVSEKAELENEYHLLLDEEGWTGLTSAGSAPAVQGKTAAAPGGVYTLKKSIFPEEMGENVLLFVNKRQCVTVTVDGETRFRLGAGERKFKMSANGYCTVPLPEVGRPVEVDITFSNLENEACSVPEIYFGSLNDILIFLVLRDIVTFSSLPLWLLLGVALAALSIFLQRRKIREYRVISLSIFLLCATLWSFTDMTFTWLLPVDMEVMSIVSHYLLMLLPLPILFYIHWSCKFREPLTYRSILLVLLSNMVGQTALFLLNAVSLHQTLVLSHALLLFMLFYGAAATGLDYRAHPSDEGKLQSIAFGISSVMGCSVVAVYWWMGADTNVYRSLFQLTIFAFLVAMMGVLMYSVEQGNYRSKVRDAELNAYRTISTTDQLTGLGNRRAFDKQMETVTGDETSFPNAVLVFMDLNGLKYANDKFGHMAGDELIIAAARCIRTAFEGVGMTYRIGGDEFAAIIEATPDKLQACCAVMDTAIEAYNAAAQVPLSVARGSCPLVNTAGERLSLSDWKMYTDKKMYEDKVIRRRANAYGSAEDYLEVISSFVSAVDAKDSYTADHSERVGQLSDCICHLLGLSDTSADQIHIAARLHDIGKIGIPDSILLKTGKLTDEEWRIMQSHTIVGEEIIKHTRAFYDVSQIIRHHHERVDGKGYPDHISGMEIPLGSRIIAIADSIDAMTSNRSYREARSLAFCREEIEKNLGVMYDAAIGAIVLEHWNQIEAIVLAKPVPNGELPPEETEE